MLRELFIQDLAIIDEVRVEFAPGFNVLTGETGAGKSILVDALALLLGGKEEVEQLRSGAEEACIEAAFDASSQPDAVRLLLEEGIPHEPDDDLIVRRRLPREGKSKAYLNGRSSSAATLRALGSMLVDVQGHGQPSSLVSQKQHLHLLDAYAGLTEEARTFKGLFEQRQALQRELEDLRRRERERAQRRDLLDYQRREIDAAHLREGEEDTLSAERVVLVNVEKLSRAVGSAYTSLYASEGAVLEQLAEIAGKLKDASKTDTRLHILFETCEAAIANLEEVATALRAYQERLQFDPARLEAVEERLYAIEQLRRKYGPSIAEVLRYREAIARELEGFEHLDGRIRVLEQTTGALEAALQARAEALSVKRAEAARRLEGAVVAQLRELGMPQATFEVSFHREGEVGRGGKDQVEFLVSFNRGEARKPIQKIASCGELSRAMLAVKVVLASADQVPTLVFDEVDVGVGGGMAEVVGKKLSLVSRERQVLCVTHLPQIAAFADAHFQVFKQSAGGRMRVAVRRLHEGERVEELARMLGGKGSALPRQYAEELLGRAEAWKRSLSGSLTHELVEA